MLTRAAGFLVLLFSTSISPAADIKPELEVLTGFDGANPQSASDVVREADNRFRVRPFNEEGSNDAYWFRFNTLVVNHGSRTRDVEFIVEWPVLERHPDYEYDTYYYGDKGNWRWVYARIEGIEAKLSVPCPPGSTYVGFYPRYSYAQCEEFVQALVPGRFLSKQLEGKSRQGRNIWTIRLTDSQASQPAGNRILITTRNHPYETGGSYIVEEIVRYLTTSAEPGSGGMLQGNDIYIIPMMNPDGVATGCNQRTAAVGGVNMSFGSDSDDPAVLALLGVVNRVKPGLWVDVHSWPHKGDDGMWCTHRWVADAMLAHMPEGTFNGYVWNLSFVDERGTAENHLWRWLMRTHGSGGVSLSFSWYRRNEEDLQAIGRKLIEALCDVQPQ